MTCIQFGWVNKTDSATIRHFYDTLQLTHVSLGFWMQIHPSTIIVDYYSGQASWKYKKNE